MDIQKTTPEVVPEIEANAKPVGIEATSVAEVIQQSPAQPITQPVTNVVSDDTVIPDPIISDNISKEEVDDLNSSIVEKVDNNWVGRVQKVIKEDEGQPYKEETDSEVLNEEYMKNRFNVDIDAPIEEGK